ncbi:hypothetical protein DK254_08355 [Pseudomonas sp. RW407]|uniref:Lar family restriction alleviation protein n=1 Tax=Pseudomonas sp. RW407 TaxID=2202894 RepID=UPI000D6F69D8|nr:Lar family restriction alleviation protein [Pseudomonas sp. RW407]PWU30124.1 hypothetical protein DK254_08355 [Pseudomonas sp. RW407]
MSIELKPCPFCGAKPICYRFAKKGWAAECENCDFEMLGANEPDVAAKWNARAPVAQAGQVPEKPTEAMLQAGMNAMAEAQRNGSQSLYVYAGVCWDAMLAAAPQPAEGDGIDHAWCDGVCDE